LRRILLHISDICVISQLLTTNRAERAETKE
jgi:hypothetical protein